MCGKVVVMYGLLHAFLTPHFISVRLLSALIRLSGKERYKGTDVLHSLRYGYIKYYECVVSSY